MTNEDILDDVKLIETLIEQMEFQLKYLPKKKADIHWCFVPRPESCRVCQFLIGRAKKLAKQEFSHQFADVSRKRRFLKSLHSLYALRAYDVVGDFINRRLENNEYANC